MSSPRAKDGLDRLVEKAEETERLVERYRLNWLASLEEASDGAAAAAEAAKKERMKMAAEAKIPAAKRLDKMFQSDVTEQILQRVNLASRPRSRSSGGECWDVVDTSTTARASSSRASRPRSRSCGYVESFRPRVSSTEKLAKAFDQRKKQKEDFVRRLSERNQHIQKTAEEKKQEKEAALLKSKQSLQRRQREAAEKRQAEMERRIKVAKLTQSKPQTTKTLSDLKTEESIAAVSAALALERKMQKAADKRQAAINMKKETASKTRSKFIAKKLETLDVQRQDKGTSSNGEQDGAIPDAAVVPDGEVKEGKIEAETGTVNDGTAQEKENSIDKCSESVPDVPAKTAADEVVPADKDSITHQMEPPSDKAQDAPKETSAFPDEEEAKFWFCGLIKKKPKTKKPKNGPGFFRKLFTRSWRKTAPL